MLKSTYQLLGLPNELAITISILSLVLFLSAWLSGHDFGIFKIPDFNMQVRKVMRVLGPIILVTSMAMFYPYWEISQIPDQLTLTFNLNRIEYTSFRDTISFTNRGCHECQCTNRNTQCCHGNVHCNLQTTPLDAGYNNLIEVLGVKCIAKPTFTRLEKVSYAGDKEGHKVSNTKNRFAFIVTHSWSLKSTWKAYVKIYSPRNKTETVTRYEKILDNKCRLIIPKQAREASIEIKGLTLKVADLNNHKLFRSVLLTENSAEKIYDLDFSPDYPFN